MSDPNANYWYARLISETLQQHDVSAVVLCPGNRNAPLLFALQAAFPDQHYIHIDERSAAFMALGLAKQRKKPVAICMTSGSAVANVLPALCEAHASGIPLIILSADRPDYLHGSGAPQCMTQQHIFKPFVADSLHIAIDKPDHENVPLALTQIANTLQYGHAARPMPVHINVTFDDPLAPHVDDLFTTPEIPTITAPSTLQDFASNTLPATSPPQQNVNGLIICGPDAPINKQDIIALATETGFPVLADAASNLRRPDIPNLIEFGDHLVKGELGNETCDVLLRIGSAPINRPLYEFCAKQQCAIIRIDNHEVRKDFVHQQFHCLTNPTEDCSAQIRNTYSCNDAWRERWINANAAKRAALTTVFQDSDWGECSAANSICNDHRIERLQLANSMAIRHANMFMHASDKEIISHRGVNGIDGTISSFIGANLDGQKNSALLCGDIAFFHDLPALHAARYVKHSAIIFVINNNGGHIFDLLPIAGLKDISELLHTPQDCKIRNIAEAFGLNYNHCSSYKELDDAIQLHLSLQALSIIEVEVAARSLKEQMGFLKVAE